MDTYLDVEYNLKVGPGPDLNYGFYFDLDFSSYIDIDPYIA